MRGGELLRDRGCNVMLSTMRGLIAFCLALVSCGALAASPTSIDPVAAMSWGIKTPIFVSTLRLLDLSLGMTWDGVTPSKTTRLRAPLECISMIWNGGRTGSRYWSVYCGVWAYNCHPVDGLSFRQSSFHQCIHGAVVSSDAWVLLRVERQRAETSREHLAVPSPK